MVKPFHAPRPSQWQAIRATDDHVLVVAGAGTGKTHTVVGRILYLLGVPMLGERCPRTLQLTEIAAITFTNEAARDLKNSLREALKASGRREEAWQVDGARIGTIHSFCLEILRENALRAGLSPTQRLLEEGVALELATEVARDTLVDALETGSVEDLEILLGQWSTSQIDQWVVSLMRKPDRVRELDREAASGRAASDDPTPGPERALVRLARLATERLDAILERDEVLDFDRIILRTRNLLRDDAEVCRALQRRIHTLVIDEFQDVDPAQKEIAYLLGAVAEGRRDSTRLMLVGDPKQSIYRFRGADVSVWNAVARDFQGGAGQVLPLIENFRSVPGILAMVEATAGRLLAEPLDGVAHRDFEVRFQAVAPERADLATPPAEFLLVPATDEGRTRSADEIRELEAQLIARRIRELRADGVPYQDIAILFATWSNVERYEDALRDAGIPWYTLRRDGFLDARVVHDLILALEVIRDPEDTRALFGFLRSPFVGVRDETLLRLVLTGELPHWRNLDRLESPQTDDGAEVAGAPAGESETGRLARAAELIDRYVSLRDRVPVAELLTDLLLESGYLGHLQLSGEPGLQALANVRQFLTMAREQNDVSVGDLIRVLRERRARGDRVPEAVVHARNDNVVTITSIHVAKGLEWGTVIWADLAARKPSFTEKLVLTRQGIRLGEPDISADDQPDDRWREFRGILVAEEDAERKRLWYVAATRAKDRLILSGVHQGSAPGGDSVSARLRTFFPALLTAHDRDTLRFTGMQGGTRPAKSYTATVRVGDATTVQPAERTAVEPDTRGDSIHSTVPGTALLELPREQVFSPVGPPRHSATEYLTHDRCPRRHWFKYVAGIREPELDAEQRDELISAVHRGQIVHDVLERYEEDEELDGLLEDAIGRWDENAPPPESDRGQRYRDHLRLEVTRIVNHPDYAALARKPGARRELPFLFMDAGGIVAQGSIDLAVPVAGEAGPSIALLDVKTTQCEAHEAPAKAAQYASQRDVYVAAARGITGLPVSRFAFQFSRAGTQVSMPITPAEETAAGARFAATAAAIGQGAPPLTQFPYECRFCGYRRVRLCPGARFGERNADDALVRLSRDRFRARFALGAADLETVRRRGLDGMMAHARVLITERLAPAAPAHDGRQTPWRGHPVFIAQHATACCCRRCLEEWHGIARGHALGPDEVEYVLAVIERWLRAQQGDDAATVEAAARAVQLDLL